MPIPFVALLGAVGRAAATTAARSAVGAAASRGVVSAAGSTLRAGMAGARLAGSAVPAKIESKKDGGGFSDKQQTIASLIDSLGKAKEGLDDWKDGLVESAKALGTYNGQISAANAKLEAGDVRRAVQSGQAQSKTAKALIESENARRDAGRPQNDFWANMGNRATTFWNNANTLISRGINAAVGFKEKPGDSEQGGRTDQQFARGVEDSLQGYFLNAMQNAADYRPSDAQVGQMQKPRQPIVAPVARKPKR